MPVCKGNTRARTDTPAYAVSSHANFLCNIFGRLQDAGMLLQPGRAQLCTPVSRLISAAVTAFSMTRGIAFGEYR